MPNPITELANGLVDGTNATFSTNRDYKPGSLKAFRDGILGEPLSELTGKDFLLEEPLVVGSVLTVYYHPI